MKVCEVPGLYIMYVSTFELQSQNTTDQVAYKQQKFIAHVLVASSLRSWCEHGKKKKKRLLSGLQASLYFIWWNGLGMSLVLLLFCNSVTKSCPTLCNPMNYSMLGFPALHCLLEFANTHAQ